MEAKTVKSLVEELTPEKLDALRTDPKKFLDENTYEMPINDKNVFLTVLWIVGVVLITAVILGSVIIFMSPDKQNAKVPEFLVSIGSTALGALVGLLAPSPARQK